MPKGTPLYTDYESIGYPFNLIDTIFMQETEWANDKDHIDGLNHALETLTDREREVIHKRFEEFKTLEQVARDFGLTRERIRQIEAHGIRKLRHASRRNYILNGYVACAELKKLSVYKEELDKREKDLEEREAIVEAREKSLEEILSEYKPRLDALNIAVGMPMEKIQSNVDLYKIRIAEMDLSVRSYNCLIRQGIRTVGDLVNLCENDNYLDLKQVRNLGRKSLEEIIFRLYYMTGKDFRAKYGI